MFKKSKKTVLIVGLLIITMLTMMLSGCGKSTDATKDLPDSEKYVFTDSCGREVELPKKITKIAPSGATAQMILMTIAPEMLVGLASSPSSEQQAYFPEDMWYLPTFGQFYGSKANMNMESLIAAEPQVILDIGDRKDTHTRDMNTIQKQTGIATVFVEADLEHFPEAYRTLGKLLGKEKKGEELASYIEDVLAISDEKASQIGKSDKKTVMYGTGSTGLACNAKGSIQADVIEQIGAENAIITEEITDKGGGTLVSMEEVYKVDPDVIILAEGGPYSKLDSEKSEWKDLTAVKNGEYYEIPNLPYCWMSSPPSVNRIIGILWLGKLLYPEIYDYDMAEKAKEFYKLFWNYDLSDEEVEQMLGNSTLK